MDFPQNHSQAPKLKKGKKEIPKRLRNRRLSLGKKIEKAENRSEQLTPERVNILRKRGQSCRVQIYYPIRSTYRFKRISIL